MALLLLLHALLCLQAPPSPPIGMFTGVLPLRCPQWGLLERRRGQLDAAARCFARGVKAAPRNPYLWQVRAWVRRCVRGSWQLLP